MRETSEETEPLAADFPKGTRSPSLGMGGAPLTLARTTGAVVAPNGPCPPAQAPGAATVFRQAVGAAQPPTDQALDVLDCERTQEGPSYPGATLLASECCRAQGRGLWGIGHPVLIA